MVLRQPARCLICKGNLVLRIGIGAGDEQRHEFACPHCRQNLVIVLDLSAPPAVGIKSADACEALEEEQVGAVVVNLHPDFLISEELRHADQVFPWLEQSHAMLQEEPSFDRDRHSEIMKKLMASDRNFPHLRDSWAALDRAWSLEKEGRHDLAQSVLATYEHPFYEGEANASDALFHFLKVLFGHGLARVLNPALAAVKAAHAANGVEYLRFCRYYLDDVHARSGSDLHDLLGEFFKSYEDFGQCLLNVKFQVPIPDRPVTTSENFKNTKMFYGNAFEAIADHFVLPAALNNIIQGRAFDEFERMDLKRYVTLDKAGRSKAFAASSDLAPLAVEFDNQLRNASHHRRLQIDRASNVLTYQNRETGKTQRLRYAEYLLKCGTILCHFSAIHIVGMMIKVQME